MSADEVFVALADPTRRRLVELLAERAATATELGRELGVTRQAAAKHLVVLERAGLAIAERSGREARYRLTPEPMTDAARWMADVGRQWDEALGRLARFLETPRRN